MKQVTAPILLTRGSPWAPSLRILIADAFNTPDEVTRAKIFDLSHRLRRECHGWFSEPEVDSEQDPKALCGKVARKQTDILVMAAPEGSQRTSAEISKFETLYVYHHLRHSHRTEVSRRLIAGRAILRRVPIESVAPSAIKIRLHTEQGQHQGAKPRSDPPSLDDPKDHADWGADKKDRFCDKHDRDSINSAPARYP